MHFKSIDAIFVSEVRDILGCEGPRGPINTRVTLRPKLGSYGEVAGLPCFVTKLFKIILINLFSQSVVSVHCSPDVILVRKIYA